MGLCSFPVHVRVAPWTLHSGSELVDVLHCDSTLLDSCSCTWQWRDWDWVDSNFWSNHCPLAICQLCWSLSLIYSVAPALRLRELRVPMIHSATSFFMPCQIPNLYQGFILFMESVKVFFANTFSPRRQTLLTVSCHAVSRIVFSRHDLSDTWNGCNVRVPPTTAELASLP